MKKQLWEGIYASLNDVPVTGDGFRGDMWQKNSLQKVSEFKKLAKTKQTIPLVTSFHDCLLPFITAVIHTEKGKVKLLDFGGGIGFLYYQVMGGGA